MELQVHQEAMELQVKMVHQVQMEAMVLLERVVLQEAMEQVDLQVFLLL